jgi:hypothetical protein
VGVHHNQLNKAPKQRYRLPTVPVRLELKVQEDKVKYQVGRVGVTNERREYFEDEADVESGEAPIDWSGDGEIPGMEMGRIVETRRCVSSRSRLSSHSWKY